MNFNHRGTENTGNTDSSVQLGWKEDTEAAFGRDIDRIHVAAHKEDLCALCASVVKDQEAIALEGGRSEVAPEATFAPLHAQAISVFPPRSGPAGLVQ